MPNKLYHGRDECIAQGKELKRQIAELQRRVAEVERKQAENDRRLDELKEAMRRDKAMLRS